jgi:3D-(3,5/4)-trihydroxycyclohexane-1,2-dione acylhydrolase (decyclizing)
MLCSDIVTSIQEGYKLIIVLIDSLGYNSIGGLSRSLGQQGFGTRFAYPENNRLPGDEAGLEVKQLPVDLAMNARGLGAHTIECRTFDEFTAALAEARTIDKTTVITIQNDRYVGVPGYESWWDVPVAEVSEMESVRSARAEWEVKQAEERYWL